MALSLEELEDLYQAVGERIDEALLSSLIRANRTERLSELLELLGMEDLLGDDGHADICPTRVAILGGSAISPGQIRSIIEERDLDIRDFELELEYDLEHYNFGKFRDTLTYRAVLIGPSPHSTPGMGDSSSAIANMQAHPETYPPVIVMRDKGGKPKITRNSLENALDELALIP